MIACAMVGNEWPTSIVGGIMRSGTSFRNLNQAIVGAKEKVRFCRECFSVAEGDLCRICRDPGRDVTVICVVEEPKDQAAIEKAGVIKGRYHVLGGAISPLEGIGPDDLRVQELLDRVQRNGVGEVILATNPNLEGNATAMYIAGLLKPSGVRVTRLARATRVRLRLSERARLTVTVRRGGQRVARVSRAAVPGPNTLKVRRRLRPGRYAVIARAVDAAGNHARPVKVGVRVRRR